ncbi:MAG: EAL domain-containing protein [Candidatus Berkiella sp.]
MAVYIISGFFIILVVVASLATTLYFSWQQARESERDKLYAVSSVAKQRIQDCFDRVYRTLDRADKIQSAPCSEEHLTAMRNLAFKNSYVSDIEYLENNTVKCSSSGLNSSTISIPTQGYQLANNVTLLTNISPLDRHWKKYIGLKRDNYNVLVDSKRLTDLGIDSYFSVAIVTDKGQVMSTLNSPDPEIIEQVIKKPSLRYANKQIVAVDKMPDLYIIVSESRSYVLKKWREDLLIFAPFGIVLAIALSAIVLYFSKRRLSLYGELKLAIKRKEFINYYQPIIDNKTNACIGAEALVRWQRSDGTMVRPDLFIPLAEETGLIIPLTDQVLQHIVKDLKHYFIDDRNFHVAINVDVRDFVSGRIFTQLESTLEGTGIERDQIWLEITERGLIDIAASKEKITRARESGYVIVIDDFGTGYSSLSYLRGLPLDVLKIDKSFVSTVATDSATSSVTYHIINIAKSLNLKIVAEGIELREQAEYLIEKEVDYAQGWLYAKAMPLDEFIAFYQVTNKNLKEIS